MLTPSRQGWTSRRKLQEQEGRWLKLISGAVMLGLGVVLIAKPGWLMV